jgi:hypothetical protein
MDERRRMIRLDFKCGPLQHMYQYKVKKALPPPLLAGTIVVLSLMILHRMADVGVGMGQDLFGVTLGCNMRRCLPWIKRGTGDTSAGGSRRATHK